MNTTENNKIIAEFMGMKENYFTGAFKNVDNKFLFPSELVYHSDWNWLIQVVDKIESLGFETSLTKENFFIRMAGGNTQKGIMYTNKKEAVYNACVEFIEWWNKV